MDSRPRINSFNKKGVKAMPRFIAVHTMPMTEEQAMALFKSMPALPQGVSWKQTYCDFKDGKFFCEWEAPNEEIIEQAFKAQKLPFDAVYPVKLFNVAKQAFED
jgi:hypothetical protein